MRSTTAALIALALVGLAAAARPAQPVLRVGTSGDYAPFSVETTQPGGDEAGRFRGFDPAVAKAYARDRGLRIRWVRFRWPELLGLDCRIRQLERQRLEPLSLDRDPSGPRHHLLGGAANLGEDPHRVSAARPPGCADSGS